MAFTEDMVALVLDHAGSLKAEHGTGRMMAPYVRRCSSTQLGLDPVLLRVAAAAAEEVLQPDDWSCCAFAGDRGLLHPELTAAATAAEAQAMWASHRTVHVSVNRT